MKSVLITGAAGFLGSHLVEYFLKNEIQVIGVDNLITGQIDNIHPLKKLYPEKFHFLKYDVTTDWPLIEAELQILNLHIVTIFHFASPASVPHYQKYSLETMAANSIGLKNCLELSLKTNSKIIFASTSEIYGNPDVSPQNENYWGHVNSYGPRSCYDESKRFGEALIYSWNKKYNTKHGIVRIFNTYGPRMNLDDGRVILRFLTQAINHEPLTIYGDGQQKRSFCYVDDLITGIVNYQKSDEYKPMNLGREEQISISELAQAIIKLTNSKSKIANTALPTDDPEHRLPDLKLAKSRLNYASTTDLNTGLLKMILWLKNTKSFVNTNAITDTDKGNYEKN